MASSTLAVQVTMPSGDEDVFDVDLQLPMPASEVVLAVCDELGLPEKMAAFVTLSDHGAELAPNASVTEDAKLAAVVGSASGRNPAAAAAAAAAAKPAAEPAAEPPAAAAAVEQVTASVASFGFGAPPKTTFNFGDSGGAGA
jgi:hypothetical protein